VVFETLVWNDAYMMPPRPAIAADTAKRPSLTRIADTPDVAAPTSEERTAAILRPQDEILRFRMASITRSTMARRTSAIVRSLEKLRGPMTNRGSAQPEEEFVSQFHWNRTVSPRIASARVASAR
jgi:hypothetical protein